MALGQIVYNLEDYHSSGGLISTLADCSGTITSSNPNYESGKIKIFGDENNLVTKFKATSFSRLGIQAPPGTRFVINTSKKMIMGRTGIYELDEDLKVTNLYFESLPNYILDQEATQAKLVSGATKLKDADDFKDAALLYLDDIYFTPEYWEEYLKVFNGGWSKGYLIEDALDYLDSNFGDDDAVYQQHYLLLFQDHDQTEWGNVSTTQRDTKGFNQRLREAELEYNQGINGVYKLPEEGSGLPEYQELHNIIVDFVY